jgi:hypothetical protein
MEIMISSKRNQMIWVIRTCQECSLKLALLKRLMLLRERRRRKRRRRLLRERMKMTLMLR